MHIHVYCAKCIVGLITLPYGLTYVFW